VSSVGAELWPWLQAARGAVQWLLEAGEAELEVPAAFQMPPLGRIPLVAQPVVEEAASELHSVLERRPPVPGLPPQPFDLKGEAGETTFIDTPSLLEGPAEAALVYGWSAVQVAFVAGPLPEDATAELLSLVGEQVVRMAGAMGLTLGQVFFGYLAGPNGQRPTAHAARLAVRRQLAVAKPKVIVSLGDFATRTLCGSSESFSRSRSNWFEFEGIPVLPTFHPEALLQNDGDNIRKAIGADLKKVMRKLAGR